MLRLRLVSPAFVSEKNIKNWLFCCFGDRGDVVNEPGRAKLLCGNSYGGAIATAPSLPAPAAAAASAAVMLPRSSCCCC